MFEVNDTWQDKRANVLLAVFSETQSRRYHLVELTSNVQMFHVDIDIEIEGEPFCSRLILSSIREVLGIVDNSPPSTVKISLQSSRRNFQDYLIDVVEEVYESTTNLGAYFYKCKGGAIKSDSLHDLPFDATSYDVVWRAG